MTNATDEVIRGAVRERYAGIARSGGSCCGSDSGAVPITFFDQSAQLGYSVDELGSVPEGANLGLGCGNPQAIAAIKPGEVVLDLGSGAGFDCFLAARQVGVSGKVIGVDMTPDMLVKARENARKGRYENVDFRLGEIEHLPVADASVDVIISNCVINLSTDKPAVFREAFRVLKPGGRLAVSDVVATAELPEDVKGDLVLYSACAAGALGVPTLERMLAEAGFGAVRIAPKDESREFIRAWAPDRSLEDFLLSASIEARKPG